jgi:plasmid stabilization system protein ParE
MRTVVWSEQALTDFDNQFNNIALKSPKKAARLAGRIELAVMALADVPIGRFGLATGTYRKRLPETTLSIAYQVDAQGDLAIVHIINSARDWNEEWWPLE